MRGRNAGALLRLAALCGWLAVIALARAGVEAPERLLVPVGQLSASFVQAVMGWIGVAAQRDGALLFVPGRFAYEVDIGCTGLLPAAVLIIAILATPAGGAARRRGLVVGVPLVLAVNLLRLSHLFYLGVNAPRAFAVAHSVVWEGVMVVTTFATWLLWARWAARGGAAVRER